LIGAAGDLWAKGYADLAHALIWLRKRSRPVFRRIPQSANSAEQFPMKNAKAGCRQFVAEHQDPFHPSQQGQPQLFL
jgi:hypothetical protein